MRIAIFSDNFYPELSGITDTVILTGIELKKMGNEICYVSPRYSRKDYEISRLEYQEGRDNRIEGMPIIRLPSIHVPSPTGQSRFVVPIWQSIAFLKSFKPDVIHTQSPYGIGWEALQAAKRLRVPLIGTNHTAVEDFFPFASIMRAYDAWYYNHCDFVTTPYKTLITRMQEKGFKKEARAMANPVDLTSYYPPTNDEKNRCKQEFKLDGPVLLYTGRLGAEKNVDVIIRAVVQLVLTHPNITFVATGHGAAEPELKTLIKKLGIDRNVRFVGFIADEALPRLYRAADAFVIMSTSDSQSLSLMKAYASGIPAVCARSRGLPDYTPEDCGFLVEPGDYRTLAEKLSILLSNKEMRERMGKSAQIFVGQFSKEKIAREWEGIYQSVIINFET